MKVKKLLVLFLSALVLTGAMIGITSCDLGSDLNDECTHVFDNATCTAPRTCRICKATEGEALGHVPATSGDCEMPILCTRCHAMLGGYHQHSWVDATCTVAKHCEKCNVTQGTALGHIDENRDHVCDKNCGSKSVGTHADAANDNDHVCDWGCGVKLESCSDAKGDGNHACDICGKPDVTAHSYGDATCDTPPTCSECGKTNGDALVHIDENKDHVCDHGCSATVGDCVDADKDHDCDYGCGKSFGTCEDSDFDHACDYGCGKSFGTCEDADFDHACDYGCDKSFGTCEDTDFDHACDYGCDKSFGEHSDSDTDDDHLCDWGCGETLEDCSDAENDNDHSCDVCDKADVTGHSFNDATCDTPKTCSECGKTDGEPLSHSWVDPTCTENGYCSLCSAPGEAATGHSGGNATCATLAVCGSCGKEYGKYLDHTFDAQKAEDKYIATDATCTTVATYYYSCSGCGAADTTRTFNGTTTKGHDLGEWVYENGSHTRTCKSCHTYTESGTCAYDEASEHGSAATCTNPAVCSTCLHEFGDKLDHSWNGGEITTQPTCTAPGVKTYTCGICGETKTENLGAVGHSFGEGVVTVNPTCTASGVKTFTCGSCGEEKTEDIAPVGHLWNIESRTCDEGQECTREGCDATTEPLGHSYKLIGSTEATCTEAKKNEYECSSCGDTYTQSVGSPKEHNIVGVIPTNVLVEGKTCEYYQHYQCKDCPAVVVAEKTVTSHETWTASITTHATCTEAGEKLLTCAACGETKTEEIAVDTTLGHAWDAGVTEGGITTYTCTHNSEHTKTVKVITSEDKVSGDDLDNQLNVGDTSFELDEGVKDVIGDKEISISSDKLTDEEKAELNLDTTLENQIGNSPIYNFTINDGENLISDFNGGKIKVTLPYTLGEGEDVDSIAIWFISDKCALEGCKEGDACNISAHRLVSIEATFNRNPDSDNDREGFVTFETDHFSRYTVTRLTPKQRCELYGHSSTFKYVAPTCIADGYTLEFCIRCGYSNKLTNPETDLALNHDYAEDVIAATCTADGSVTYTCLRDGCNHTYTVVIKALNHNYVIEDSADATCSAVGFVSYVCDREGCDASYSEVLSQLEHIMDSAVTAPTCSDGGYTTHFCTREGCGYSYTDTPTAPAGHSYEVELEWYDTEGEKIPHGNPNNSKYSGRVSVKLICQSCGDEKELGDDELHLSEEVTYPTCDHKGHKKYIVRFTHNGKVHEYHVKDETFFDFFGHEHGDGFNKFDADEHWSECKCGDKKNNEKHKFDNGIVTKLATCIEEGERTYRCSCGYTKTEIIPKTNHTPSHEWMSDDSEHWHICSVCEEVVSKSEHSLGDGRVTKSASCAEEGEIVYRCSCGYTKTDIIPKTDNHKYNSKDAKFDENSHWFECRVCHERCEEHRHSKDNYEITKTPTCTEDGEMTFRCSCGYSAKEAIEALGHSYDDGDIKYNTESHWFECDVCDAKLEQSAHTAEKTEIIKAATCTEDGERLVICSCGYEKTEVIPMAGGSHSYDAADVLFDSDYHWYICTACGSVADKTEHVFATSEVTKAPDCTNEGELTSYCECGHSYTSAIPTNKNHNYSDGFCTRCGAEYSYEYYLNLVGSWKNIDGFAIRIYGLSYQVNEPDPKLPGALRILGKVEQIDIAELSLYVEDGELCGAAIGSIHLFSRYEGDNVYEFRAVIEDGYVYISIKYGELGKVNRDINVKLTTDAVLESMLDSFDVNEEAISVVGFIFESVIPEIEALAELNSEEANAILESIFNIIFTIEEEADGTYVAELDFDKLYALNENLATKTVAEVIDIYFGEGAFDSLSSLILEILDLELSEIPAYVDGLGLDSDEIIAKINSFCALIGAPEDFDISDMLNSPELEGITLGMLMCDTGDKLEADTYFNDIIGTLNTYSLYSMINSDAQEDIKRGIDAILDMASEKLSLSFITDSEGMLTSVKLGCDSLTVSADGNEVFLSFELEITVNGRVDVTWSDIIDDIENAIVTPGEDMPKDDERINGYLDGEHVNYKGTYYYFEGYNITVYRTLYDTLTGVMFQSDCGDWTYYSLIYARQAYSFTIGMIELEDGTEVTLLIDNYTDEVVELVEAESGFTAIFNDGSEKAVSFDFDSGSFSSPEEAYAQIYFAVFENPLGIIEKLGEEIDFYYNPKLNEYSGSSHHSYKYSYEFNGNSCDDGYTVTRYCENCGSVEYWQESGHITKYREIQLSELGLCGGYIEEHYCEICGTVTSANIYDHGCNWSYMGEDENGNSVYECSSCGATKLRSTIEGEKDENCNFTRTEAYVYLCGGEEIYRYERSYISEAHSYKYSYEFNGDSCDDGYTVTEYCEDCDYVHTWYSEGHRTARRDIELSELGLCGGYIEEYYCTVCGTVTSSYIDDHGCNWSCIGEDESGYSVYECSSCGATKLINSYDSEKGENCNFTRTEAYVYLYGGEEIYRYERSYISEAHSYKYSYELNGDSCDGGYTVTEYCEDCDYVRTWYSEGHRTKYREIELSELGLCGGYIEEHCCEICGTVTRANIYDHGCNWSYMGKDENGNSVYECSSCGTVKLITGYNSEKDENCNYTYTEVYIYLCGGEEIYRVERSYYHTAHRYSHEFILNGSSCNDGYTAIITCSDCDYSRTESGIGHNYYETERIILSDYGACGADSNIRIYNCACGYYSGADFNLGSCNMRGTNSYYTDKDGIYHSIYTEVCTDCGLTVVSDEYTAPDGCIRKAIYKQTVSIGGTEIYSYERIQNTYTEHSFEIKATVTDGVAAINAVCSLCGYEKIDEEITEITSGNAELEYSETAGRYCYELIFSPEISGHYVIYSNATWDTFVQLYRLVDGEYVFIRENDDGGNGNNFRLEEYLDAGETYVYRISNLNSEASEPIPYVLTEGDGNADCSHRYTSYYLLAEGSESCTDGAVSVDICKSCGYVNNYYIYTDHNRVLYKTYQLSDYGVCGDECYVYTDACICGYSTYLDIYNCSCNMTETCETYTDALGIAHNLYTRVCEECGLTDVRDEYSVWEGCYYVSYSVYSVRVGDLSVISDYCRSWISSTNHEYGIPTYTFDGEESCLGGVTLHYQCNKCDYSYDDYVSYHCTILKEEINLDEYGVCAGSYINYYECPCGEEARVDYNFNCGTSYSGDVYTDANGVRHATSNRACTSCNLTAHFDDYAVTENCERIIYRAWLVSVDGVEIFSCTNDKHSRDTDHSYVYDYVFDNGEDCEGGVTVYVTCSDCDYENSYYRSFHSTDLTERYWLFDYGSCHIHAYLDVRACACGEDTYVSVYTGCAHQSSTNNYYDEDGRYHTVQANWCDKCGYRYQDDYYTVRDKDTCTVTDYHRVWVNIGAEHVFELSYERTSDSHDYAASGALMDGSLDCNDGVVITYVCRDCNLTYESTCYRHEMFEKERYDLTEYGALCPGYMIVKSCVCGKNVDAQYDSLCHFNDVYVNDTWAENAIKGGQYNSEGWVWFDYYGYNYTCSVTDPEQCGFVIRYTTYWAPAPDKCLAYQYKCWQIGYNEADGTYAHMITYKTGEAWTYHPYKATSLYESWDNGCTKRSGTRFDCPLCESFYYEIDTYSENGNQLTHEIRAENKLDNGDALIYEYIHSYDSNGRYISTVERCEYADGSEWKNEYGYIYHKGYQYVSYSYEYKRDGAWYKYDYTYNFNGTCERTTHYTSSSGDNSAYTESCHISSVVWEQNPTCTQDGYYDDVCYVCESVLNDNVKHSPYDHNWRMVEADYYVCTSCGIENINGASGNVVLEDLTVKYGGGENFVAGYWVRNNIQFIHYVSLILHTPMADGNDEIILDGIEVFELEEARALAFNRAAVIAAAQALGYSPDEYYVRFAFVPLGADGSYDYAITFTEDDYIPIYITGSENLALKVSGDSWREIIITPEVCGEWTMYSYNNSFDVYGELYDENGNLITSDDDSGDGNNFYIASYLEAGKAYTLRVRFLSYPTAQFGTTSIAVTAPSVSE